MRGAAAVSISILGLVICLACAAQENVTVSASPNATGPKGPVGVVNGTVYCADTNAPARLATVVLIPAAGGGAARQTQTSDLDGRFAISQVPEGRYYVGASLAGYQNPLGDFLQNDLSHLSPDARKELESRLIVVSISAKMPAQLSIRLERAGEVDGTVLYDDGSPAIGLQVDVKPKSMKATVEARQYAEYADAMTTHSDSTDDHGRYRIVGVSPGEYIVSVTVPASSSESAEKNPFISMMQSSSLGSLTVYYGDVFRSSKAKPVKIETAGSTANADFTIPLSKLHSVRGRMVLKSTGEPPPSGVVALTYADAPETARVGLVVDGEFSFFYVPEGSYRLVAAANAEPLPQMGSEDGEERIFIPSELPVHANPDKPVNQQPEGDTSVPVLVTGDVTGIVLSVPDPTPAPPSSPAIAVPPLSPAAPASPGPQ